MRKSYNVREYAKNIAMFYSILNVISPSIPRGKMLGENVAGKKDISDIFQNTFLSYLDWWAIPCSPVLWQCQFTIWRIKISNSWCGSWIIPYFFIRPSPIPHHFFYFCDLLKNLIFLVISRFEPWEVELLPNFDTFLDF